jgi:hypothetical protein
LPDKSTFEKGKYSFKEILILSFDRLVNALSLLVHPGLLSVYLTHKDKDINETSDSLLPPGQLSFPLLLGDVSCCHYLGEPQ